MNPIRVFLVDDSAVVRQVLQAALTQDPGIEVVGSAQDPLFAWQRIEGNWPDVLIVDIEMPRMDGISFLRKVMSEHPLPVIICSSLAESGTQFAIDALAAGAVQIITKPQSGVRDFLQRDAQNIIQAVKVAARARIRPAPTLPRSNMAPPANVLSSQRSTEKVIAIGTSTGGTQALEFVLSHLPATLPGLVIVQHMPEKFTAAFAARLNSLSALEVREARDGDRVLPGRALIAPGGKHMRLTRSGAQFQVQVFDGPLVKHHRPSVDVLFRSVAELGGRNAWGVIMTGMGDDGAQGLAAMHQAGARTLAQDEESCVVFGMPKEAIRLGAVDEVLPRAVVPAPSENVGPCHGESARAGIHPQEWFLRAAGCRCPNVGAKAPLRHLHPAGVASRPAFAGGFPALSGYSRANPAVLAPLAPSSHFAKLPVLLLRHRGKGGCLAGYSGRRNAEWQNRNGPWRCPGAAAEYVSRHRREPWGSRGGNSDWAGLCQADIQRAKKAGEPESWSNAVVAHRDEFRCTPATVLANSPCPQRQRESSCGHGSAA